MQSVPPHDGVEHVGCRPTPRGVLPGAPRAQARSAAVRGCTARQEAATVSCAFELPRTREAPWLARQRLGAWVAADLDAGELADAKLLASELVTNALIHGHGRIEIHAELDRNILLVEVIDEGKGFERIVREQDFDRVGGRGLDLVDALASRWGIHEGSSHVWFELECRELRLGASNKPQTENRQAPRMAEGARSHPHRPGTVT